MRTKPVALLSCVLVLSMLLALAAPVSAADAVGEIQALVDGIVGYKQAAAGVDSVQAWIDGALTEEAGISAEWYVIALSQSGDYDFSAYADALRGYLAEAVVKSATTRQKYALALIAAGERDDPYIAAVMDGTIGEQGVMSLIYGLHLLNHGVESAAHTAQSVTETLLSLQLADGGWALRGETGDVDVTAMAVQALAPYDASDAAVADAIDRALACLSERQLEAGDYASYGTPNAESTAQVITALTSLGVDCLSDPRFVKDGNTLLDGLRQYHLPDGGFSHTPGGSQNEMATAQAYAALVGYLRMAAAGTEAPRATTAAVASASPTEGVSYKPVAAAVIVGLAAVACLVFYLTGKRHRKNFLAVLVLAALAILFVCATDFASADDYYHGGDAVKDNAVGTVTLTIRCDTVAGRADHIPTDGVILDTTEFAIAQGDSVYTILTEAAQAYGIHMETGGAGDMVYLSGVANLYEFDFGDLSGWVYRVNGDDASVGCAQYVLSDGDRIEWHYTCDLGNDLP